MVKILVVIGTVLIFIIGMFFGAIMVGLLLWLLFPIIKEAMPFLIEQRIFIESPTLWQWIAISWFLGVVFSLAKTNVHSKGEQ